MYRHVQNLNWCSSKLIQHIGSIDEMDARMSSEGWLRQMTKPAMRYIDCVNMV